MPLSRSADRVGGSGPVTEMLRWTSGLHDAFRKGMVTVIGSSLRSIGGSAFAMIMVLGAPLLGMAARIAFANAEAFASRSSGRLRSVSVQARVR